MRHRHWAVLLSVFVLLFGSPAVFSQQTTPPASPAPGGGPATPKKAPAPKKSGAPKKKAPKKKVMAPTKTIAGRDGAPMVFIPAGEFLMGSPEGIGGADEHPQHRVFLNSFYIDQYEVTTARYEAYLQSTGYAPPPGVVGDPPAMTGWAGTKAAEPLRTKPVIGVSWEDAEAYCRWAGKHLPTEAEWEKAARGAKARLYPWGNEAPDGTRTNFGKQAWEAGAVLASVGAYEAGQSPYGAFEMAGNVWEWVQDWYDDAYYKTSPARNPMGPRIDSLKVIRGGSWISGPRALQAANRDKSAHISRQINLGLRCAQPVR